MRHFSWHTPRQAAHLRRRAACENRHVPQFTDEFGVAVTYYVWAVDHPRGVVQLAHGLGEYAQRYASLVEALNAAGYSVYADDHRGHGQTGLDQWGGDHRRLGSLGAGGLRATVGDLHQLTGVIRDENAGVPIVLLGHSWGSLMAQKLINEHLADFAAVVLTGTAYRMPGSMAAGDLNKNHKHLGTTGYEWLSRDPAVSAAFAADPLTFYANVPKLFGVVDGLRLFGLPVRGLPDRPLLIMIGSEDPLGGEKSVHKLADVYRARSGLSDVEVIVYPGARHEVFNETNQADVRADLIAWLNARIPAG
ncbi:MAG: alpha/beta fold hydrolase [Microbacteriaceae bacterium]|nr:MAG: alpha/beta fold hydrolase [Microbacteriaceae bacterium]